MALAVSYLNIRNNHGSVEHYYHFLLGYLLPLCAYLADEKGGASLLLARSCGPLSRLVDELQIPGLLLCERESHAAYLDKAQDLGLQVIDIFGVDGRSYEDDIRAPVVDWGSRYIKDRLADTIELHRRQLKSQWPASPRLLVIERSNPDPYYFSSLTEI